MKIFSKDTLIIVLALATIGSFAFSYWQGYFHLQMEYFLVVFFSIMGFFYLIYHKSSTTLDYKQARKKAKEALHDLGKNPVIKRGFTVADGKRFS